MSVRVMAMVWPTGLDSSAKLVLLRMADYADDEGSRVFPAVPTIARETSLSERTVQTSLRKLQKEQIISVVQEADHGKRRPREYRIDLKKLASLDRCNNRTGAAIAPLNDKNTGATTAPNRCNNRTLPVQPLRGTGATTAPYPPYEPPFESPGEASGRAGARASNDENEHDEGLDGEDLIVISLTRSGIGEAVAEELVAALSEKERKAIASKMLSKKGLSDEEVIKAVKRELNLTDRHWQAILRHWTKNLSRPTMPAVPK